MTACRSVGVTLRGSWIAVSLACVLLSGPLRGQTGPATTRPATGPTTDGYWLRVTGESVNLRSRPDTNSIPLARVERGTLLWAVGSEFGWHKVVPPEGTFCYVAAAYVERRGPTEGVVTVTTGTLRVRVGSLVRSVDPATSDVLTTLPPGTRVTILGVEGSWLRIAPPPGVFAWIQDALVTIVDAETAARLLASGATTRPVPPAARVADVPPASRPAVPTTTSPDLSGTWGQRLLAVEAQIEAEAARPVLERAWEVLLEQLRPIAAQQEDATAARLAAAWMRDLEDRIAARDALRAAQDVERQSAPQRAQRERELQRLEQARQRTTTRPAWAVCGILLPSLAVGARDGQRTFKVQDPITWKVLAYLELDPEAKVDPEPLLGRYVGISGVRRTDPALGADVVRVSEIVNLEASPASQPARPTP
jgi:hypothetical protein